MRPSRAIFATVRRDNPKNFATAAVVTNGSILLNLDATVSSTKYSCLHWEQGLCSGVGSLRFNCDLKEFKHVASTVSTGPPLSSSILTLGIHAGSHRVSGGSKRGRADQFDARC
jgi:hypothetical protein